jgi:hypothetical protein
MAALLVVCAGVGALSYSKNHLKRILTDEWCEQGQHNAKSFRQHIQYQKRGGAHRDFAKEDSHDPTKHDVSSPLQFSTSISPYQKVSSTKNDSVMLRIGSMVVPGSMPVSAAYPASQHEAFGGMPIEQHDILKAVQHRRWMTPRQNVFASSRQHEHRQHTRIEQDGRLQHARIAGSMSRSAALTRSE